MPSAQQNPTHSAKAAVCLQAMVPAKVSGPASLHGAMRLAKVARTERILNEDMPRKNTSHEPPESSGLSYWPTPRARKGRDPTACTIER